MRKQQVILGAFADEAGSSLKEQIAAMLDNGIQHLEARNIDGRNFIDHTVAEAKEIRAQLDAHGPAGVEHRFAAGQDCRDRPHAAASG